MFYFLFYKVINRIWSLRCINKILSLRYRWILSALLLIPLWSVDNIKKYSLPGTSGGQPGWDSGS